MLWFDPKTTYRVRSQPFDGGAVITRLTKLSQKSDGNCAVLWFPSDFAITTNGGERVAEAVFGVVRPLKKPPKNNARQRTHRRRPPPHFYRPPHHPRVNPHLKLAHPPHVR